MRKVEVYLTIDGQLHQTMDAAKKHADRVYGDMLTAIARELHGMKYMELAEYVDSHLEDFAVLAKLEADTVLNDEEAVQA